MENKTGQFFQENLQKKQEKFKQRINRLRQRRLSILLIIGVLMILSFINMSSAAFYMKPENIKKHFIYILVFFVIYLFIGNIGKLKKFNLTYKVLSDRKINGIILITSIIILFGMFIGGKMGLPFIPKINGAYGWINLGPISIQPAEILKCFFVINMANCLARAEDNDLSEKMTIINAFIYLFIYGVLILAQKDMGTVIHYFAIWLFMIFMSKLKDKWILRLGFLGVILGIGGLTAIYKYASEEGASYKIMRIKSYIDGLFFGNYSDDYGYQVKQSVYAFGSGGLLGKGYANGVQKYSYLPEIHTDFIMATFGEEFGIVGMFLVIGLFFALYHFIIVTGRECKNYFGKYLAMGIGAQIITQVIINIFVAVGLFPVFGLPMPFFSYGGSAMVTMGIALGLIHSMNVE
ncbi:FtsW/RodA/SpoVE family cell cycle protein [Candidatus Cetobacterium colombiensis]|uniref:FtsW/RodA/SpoVE family cell cycle protein n=1 Tax=Candidatus Cetobacterium colombiensis TaxID=3073100 RepID=A0ABU4W7I7_9FUSO|nr:FtsW/RodA/SpoVE family cell cycle protein [Candidatus Cetobacterium colombiensis]MDX8335501.1 FtsW/RodA/SpoVE family cell cycle protein [Candidatus Cetobacterium colombiensis]